MTRALLTASALLLLGAQPASARTLCVSSQPGCSPSIQPALDAASDGDVVTIAPGMYAGGVIVERSVRIRGAGAEQTVILGGGPVVTIGTYGDDTPPTVRLRGVTITGGVTRSSPVSAPFAEQEGVWALGGGVHVPPGPDGARGAKVTIASSVITGNRVAPSATVSSMNVKCPGGDPCPFAYAGGGGIDTWGELTLTDTTVSDNSAGSASGLSDLASDVMGGGILSHNGPLTLRRVVVRGNRATGAGPNGRYAIGGGVKAEAGRLTIARTRITRNRVRLAAALPGSIELVSVSGGLHVVKDVGVARISRTRLNGNAVTMTNSVGNAEAYGGAINTEVGLDLTVRGSTMSRNRVRAATVGASRGDAEADSGAGTLLGTVARVRISGNVASSRSRAGDAEAAGGGPFMFGRLIASQVSGNSVRASAPRGTASVHGAGVLVDEGPLTLRSTRVTRNRGTAQGRDAFGAGGGIFDAKLFTAGGPLTLIDSRVSGNSLRGGQRIGGGIFTSHPTSVTRSRVTGNSPDQCAGC